MIAATTATATTASAAGFPIGRLESRYELGELGVGDAAKLANLDAAELLGAEKVVHLVPADMKQFGYLLDGVCLQLASPPLVVTLRRCLSVCLRTHVPAFTCRRVRDAR
jgi:hypothetical protein